MPAASVHPPVALRVGLVVLGLGFWYLSQSLLRYRPNGTGVLGDGLHTLTAPIHRFLFAHPRWANALLILSSLCIDLLGVFVLGYSIFGDSIRPFVGLMLLFLLRQVCQALCALPPPEGIIWRYPGAPSLLVTYGVSNDLFFSGHTALAVYAAIELGLWGGTAWAVVGVLVGFFLVVVVLLLRAHYTMDVFTGAVTAFAASVVAHWCGPTCDRWLIEVGTWLGLG